MMSLRNLIPEISEEISNKYTAALVATCEKYRINTLKRQAAFLANLYVESQGFTRMSENLNYSAEGLRKVFKKYFTSRTAREYARQPERIANLVYGNRMKNGAAITGEGWKFRGRGGIMITGRDNYEKLTLHSMIDYVNNPDWLLRPMDAMKCGGWYWYSNDLNTLADNDRFYELVGRINTAKLHLVERQNMYNLILERGQIL